jgi:A/G-specific adenine glycosylase
MPRSATCGGLGRNDVGALRRVLLTWFRRSARDLPWRRTRDPYRIWLSEILLQQTRVETARPYYARFVAAFPTVRQLAAASLERVLQLWQGLGYYRRAVNLHRAARAVVRERGGALPCSAAEWQELPGVGRYTANAIASIAHREPVPVVDGNVQRVLARLFAIRVPIDRHATQARLWQLAAALLARRAPGTFNQATMELGARLCTPRRPRCVVCPLRRWCAAQRAGAQDRLPIRRTKRPSPQVDVAVALIEQGGRVLLVRRPATGLLARLWTLPGGEVDEQQPPEAMLRSRVWESAGLGVLVGPRLATVRHEFSHRRWRVRVYAARLASAGPRRTKDVRWVPRPRLADYPLASLDRKLLRACRCS